MANTCGFVLALALTSALQARAEGGPVGPQTVLVQSGELKLRALLWRPGDHPPFPAVFFSHGTGRSKGDLGRRDEAAFQQQAAVLGPLFASHGYAFLFLYRRGAGLSAGQGTIAGDLLDKELAAHGEAGRNRLYMQLLETDELSDALAGLAFLRALPSVDARRVAAVGHSFGGSLTLLLAEGDSSLRAAVDFAGAAASWTSTPELRARLLAAVGRTTVPVFIIHAANDYSVAPAEPLAAEMARLGKAHRMKIYPAAGKPSFEGHNFIHLDVPAWESDVFGFLDERMRPERAAPGK